MQLHEVPWVNLTNDGGVKVHRMKDPNVTLYWYVKGDWYSVIRYSVNAPQRTAWERIDPITAQAVLHHLVPRGNAP